MDLNIKGVDKFLVGEAKVEALRTGKTLREWVLTAIREKLNGDVTRRPKSGVRQNHSEVPADGRGASDLSADHPNPGRLHVQPADKRQGVRGVRDEVPDTMNSKGEVLVSMLEKFSIHQASHNPSPAQWSEAHKRIQDGRASQKDHS
jgi:hypothetical protein